MLWWLVVVACAQARVAPLDMPTSVARFVVVTMPRSGSTWFVKYSKLFAQCEGVVTQGEVMHPSLLERLSPSILGRTITTPPESMNEYLRYVRGVYANLAAGAGWRGELGLGGDAAGTEVTGAAVRAVGFKLMYSHLPLNGPGAPVAEHGMLGNVTLKPFLKYAAQSNVVVIHLHRLNHLERFISLATIDDGASNSSYHEADGKPTLYSRTTTSGARPRSRARLNISAAIMFARAQTRHTRHLQQFLDLYCSKLGATCLSVAYESLVGARSDEYFAALRASIGLRRCTAAAQTREVPSKPVPCGDRVSNWDEVVRSPEFRGSIWLDMCQNGNRVPEWVEYAVKERAAADSVPASR